MSNYKDQLNAIILQRETTQTVIEMIYTKQRSENCDEAEYDRLNQTLEILYAVTDDMDAEIRSRQSRLEVFNLRS